MLKKLKLKNFRTHENLELEFDKGVNVIWGLPGSGKTNILRAIDWLVTNRPKFERVHSHFAKDPETSVEMIFDDGSAKITKTATTNKFSDSNGKSYSFTNQSVPEPIAHFLNLNEINNSKQLDPHFLITSTPGDVGQVINRITKIEKIDSWISALTTKSNKTKWGIEAVEAEIETAQKELKKYDGLEDLEKEIIKFEQLEKSISDTSKHLELLDKYRDQLNLMQKRITELESLNLDSDMKQLESALNDFNSTTQILNNLSTIHNSYEIAFRKKTKLEKLNLEELSLDGLDKLIKEVDSITAQLDMLYKFTDFDGEVASKIDEISVKKDEYIGLIKKLGTCPICQNPITPKHIHKLEADL